MAETIPLLRGTWREVLERSEEIPETTRVKVVPDETGDAISDEEHRRLMSIWNEVFQEADSLPSEPCDSPPHAWGEGVIEKFRKQGFNV